MKGRNLINLLKEGDVDFVIENIEEADYRLALHDFFLEKDYAGLSDLISGLAKFYLREGLADKKDYDLLLNKARKNLKEYSESADEIFGTRGIISQFYKQALDRNVINEFLERNNLNEASEFFENHPEYNF